MRYIIFGVFIGSLIECIAYRQVHHLNYISDHSRCEHCGKKLSWYDLIPIISFILLKGRCRYCKRKIRCHILISELVGGFIGYFCQGDLLLFIVLSNLYLLSIIDFATMDVYYIDLLPLFIVDLYKVIYMPFHAYNYMSVLLVTFHLLIIIMIGRNLIGFGDILIIFLLGIYLEYRILYVLFIASLLGIIYFFYKELRLKGSLKSAIPFVPMIFYATIITFIDNIFIFSIIK